MEGKWQFVGEHEVEYAVTPASRKNLSAKMWRAKVPGGWFVQTVCIASGGHLLTFYPDTNHKWDGKLLD